MPSEAVMLSEPSELRRPFAIIVFDWDGTAVTSRTEDAGPVRQRIERLLQLCVKVVVITGTNFDNIDRQLSSAIVGPHKQNLYICTNRGSEVYGFDAQSQPIQLWRRVATPYEERLLTEVAESVRDTLKSRNRLDVEVIYRRLNRRKIDLIPLPEWREPPKEIIGDLLAAVEERLRRAGIAGGLREVFELVADTARAKGLVDARITTDVKHIEVGLTDKSDSINWIVRNLAPQTGVSLADVLIIGDEFGPIAGFAGSDYKMVTSLAQGATFVSVGKEPGGVPPEVIHLGGGPARFRALLDEQITLHQQRALARRFLPTPDPAWLLIEDGFTPAREDEIESLFAVGNGYLGTRGALSENGPATSPATFIAGVFDLVDKSMPFPELVVAPDWARMRLIVEGNELRVDLGQPIQHRRILDMRRGILIREWRHRDIAGRVTRVQMLRFASLADRHAAVECLAVSPENYSGSVVVENLIDGRVTNASGVVHLGPVRTAPKLLVARTLRSNILLAFALDTKALGAREEVVGCRSLTDTAWTGERCEFDAQIGQVYALDKFVSIYTSRDMDSPDERAVRHVIQLSAAGLDRLLSEHERAWAERWETADVEVEGDDEAQKALRFAAYHLISAANPEDERVSVGARGLTGEAYKGHVFWDTDIFMLPFYAFTHPPTARALLMYRYHTLPAARAKAAKMRYKGALYAWESADTGEETAPLAVVDPRGNVIPVLSGQQEHHISADIAYAVWQYWQTTGDDAFLRDAGAEIILETARFWASRVELGDDGCFHINKIMGPDEYHGDVSDNAYTNVMAQWNLERGVEVAAIVHKRWPEIWRRLCDRLHLTDAEIRQWSTIAQSLYIGIAPGTQLIEQFRGYFSLEDIDLKAFTPRTAPMDVLLGRQRVMQSQIIKQADVLMLPFLLWDRLPVSTWEANFRYYEPRTDHGSSLSPAVHALVAARLNDTVTAERYFRQAAEVDLADNMGNGAMGVHAGALGGLWQAAVLGFAGMRLGQDGLIFDPHLPRGWRALRFSVLWRGRRLQIAISLEPMAIEAALAEGMPMTVSLEKGFARSIDVGERLRAQRQGDVWSEWERVR